MKAKIGHYDIVTELGRGGMGVVYKGHEPALNRYVAIKVLSPALAHDEGIKERFLREARSMASLNDPHIIQIYFIGEDDGQPFFAMEFVEGESLSSYLKREGRMTPQAAARVMYQTATGLASAHDRGVIHRDIKPGNLMLDQRGRIKIADFGIALTNDVSKKLTSTGEFVGTPGYLSPEVCTGQRVDQRSDIFSLGIVLFELLTGRMPFTDESPLGLLLEVVRAEIPDVRQLNADVDAELTAILTRMTAKDPAQRYQSCHELAEDLVRHPLVSGAQTITAKPQLSAAAATVIGMKTPVSGQQSLPISGAHVASAAHVTPPPIHTGSGYGTNPQGAQPSYGTQPQNAGAAYGTNPQNAGAAYGTNSGATNPRGGVAPVSAPEPIGVRPSVLERQERDGRKPSAALPVAAVLALALIGGGAYAMRDKLPFLQSTATTTASNATTEPAAAAIAPTTSSVAPPAAPPAPAAPTPPAAEGAPVAATDAAPSTGSLAAAQQSAAAATVLAETTAAGARAENQRIDGNAVALALNSGANDDDRGPLLQDRSEADDIGPLRRLAESRRGAIAKATPPEQRREPARPAGPPRVAVVAIGDPAITGPARQMVEETLENAGLLVSDADAIPGVADIADSGRADLPRLFSALQRGGITAVAVIRAEPLGSQELTYYGQVSTLYSVNLTVRGYDVGSRDALGSGFRGKVDFAQLNAEEKAREALEPELRRISNSLSRYRPRGSGG